MAELERNLGHVEIRRLRTLDEFDATLPLQRQIWGFAEADLVAPRLFAVFDHIGGSCLGAYLDDEIVGYALAFSAIKPDCTPYWHSHMAGVTPSLQGLGIGRLLKVRQRNDALAAGIDRIDWTFDPLQARNAYFNIEKLGTEVEAYLPNFYGITSSELHGSLPTDRLVVSWMLRKADVESRLAGNPPPLQAGTARIEIPARISEVPRDEALPIQQRVRNQFAESLGAGLRVTGFERTDSGGIYHLNS